MLKKMLKKMFKKFNFVIFIKLFSLILLSLPLRLIAQNFEINQIKVSFFDKNNGGIYFYLLFFLITLIFIIFNNKTLIFCLFLFIFFEVLYFIYSLKINENSLTLIAQSFGGIFKIWRLVPQVQQNPTTKINWHFFTFFLNFCLQLSDRLWQIYNIWREEQKKKK